MFKFNPFTSNFDYYESGSTASDLTEATKVNDYTLTDSDDIIIVDATSNTVTISLHDATTAKKKIYYIQASNIDNAVTIDCTEGGQTINGAASYDMLYLNQARGVFPSDGNWVILI